ncbi:MAG: PEP-CTERM sorting domain-containing protein [Planctomycetota bacterium]
MKYSCLLLALLVFGTAPTIAQELLVNPGFEDLDSDGNFGDGWGSFGSAGFFSFFGPDNGHGSLFPDNIGNSGGFFQSGIAATPGTEYDFVLANTRIEGDFDAEVFFGLEFYEADDATIITQSFAMLADPGVEVNGGVFNHTATAPAGAAFVRPIALFDTVFSSGGQRNVFVFDASLTVVPEPASLGLLSVGGLALMTRRRHAG